MLTTVPISKNAFFLYMSPIVLVTFFQDIL